MSQVPPPILTPLNTTFYNKASDGLEGGLISPTKEEISTIFVVGFPEDMQEREFQNMFVFSLGFEAATLKIPSLKDCEDDSLKKQIIGFAKFRTRKEAIEAKDTLNGRKVDVEKGNTLKAEMAKKNLHTKKTTTTNGNELSEEQQQQQLLLPARFNTAYEAFHSVPPSSVPKDLMSPSSITNESYTEFYSDISLVGSPPAVDTRMNNNSTGRFQSRLSAVAATRFQNKELEIDCLSKSSPTHILSPPLRPMSTTSTGLMNHENMNFSRFHPSFIHTSNSTPPKSFSSTPHSPSLSNPPHPPSSPPLNSTSTPPGILSPNHSYRSLGGLLVGSTNPADQNPPCNTLYVGNLPPNAIEQELKAMFSKCPGYKRLSFRNKSNGPMCFVEFDDAIYAAQALQDLHGNPLTNSVKGGIRLSFSKNPLGVRQSANTTPTTPTSSSFSFMNRRESMTTSHFDPQLP